MSLFPSKVLLMKTDRALQERRIIANSSRFHLFLKYAHRCCLISFPCQAEDGLWLQLTQYHNRWLSRIQGLIYLYLDKHVVYNKEKVDGLGGHDKDVKAAGGLVKAHILKLTAELEGPWRTTVQQFRCLCICHVAAKRGLTYQCLRSQASGWQCRRGSRWRCTQWIPQRPLGCTHQTRCCQKGTEEFYKKKK